MRLKQFYRSKQENTGSPAKKITKSQNALRLSQGAV
jgi:hypothetical protein